MLRILCLSAILFLPGTLAEAQSTAPDPVSARQLDEAVTLMRDQGLEPHGPRLAGALNDGASQRRSIELRAGFQYLIIGTCDADCSDLDFLLTGPDGTDVDSDYEMDEVPMVRVHVTRDATYQLTVSMPGCAIEPCGYGVLVMRQ